MAELVPQDVVPLSIGFDYGGQMIKIVERGEAIPLNEFKGWQFFVDEHQCINIRIFEGERLLAAKNKFLGELKLELPSSVKSTDEVIVEMYFIVNADRVLRVEAIETVTGKNQKSVLTVADYLGEQRLTKQEVERLVAEGKQLKKKDKEELEKTGKYLLREEESGEEEEEDSE